MHLSIVIVNWNTCNLLLQCLQSISDHVLSDQSIELDVIVVDNGSSDRSVESVAGRFPQVKLVANEQNVGFARANNQAIKKSCAPYILLLNSDAYFLNNAVKTMVDFIYSDTSIGVLGASLISADGHPEASYFQVPTLLNETCRLLGLDKIVQETSPNNPLQTGSVSGACMMIRRSLIEHIGLLDESFFLFSEEVDFCYRARQAGWKVVHLPAAKVVHMGGGTTGHNAKRIMLLYKGKLHYFAKHYGARQRNLLWWSMRAASAAKGLVYSLVHWLTLGKVRKHQLWLEVTRELSQL